MMLPIQRLNVDFTAPMLEELDKRAEELNISRQAVIKTLIRQALDQHYLTNAAAALRRRTGRDKSQLKIPVRQGPRTHPLSSLLLGRGYRDRELDVFRNALPVYKFLDDIFAVSCVEGRLIVEIQVNDLVGEEVELGAWDLPPK